MERPGGAQRGGLGVSWARVVVPRCPVRHDGRVRHDAVTARRTSGCLLLVVTLLLAGCTGGPSPVEPTPTAAPTSAAPGPSVFEQVVGALSPDLVPAAQVSTCEELEPGSPEALEYLEQAQEELGGAPAQTGPAPSLPSCGLAAVEALRAASVSGLAHGPDDEVVLPVAGGAARVVDVYELGDANAAATSYAERVADPDGWARDQEVPAQDLGNGTVQPRSVVSGARVEVVDVPGWTATVLSRDEVSYASDGRRVSDPVSYAYLWAVRDAVLVRVQVAGDVPGAAAVTALGTARDLAGRVGGATGG